MPQPLRQRAPVLHRLAQDKSPPMVWGPELVQARWRLVARVSKPESAEARAQLGVTLRPPVVTS